MNESAMCKEDQPVITPAPEQFHWADGKDGMPVQRPGPKPAMVMPPFSGQMMTVSAMMNLNAFEVTPGTVANPWPTPNAYRPINTGPQPVYDRDRRTAQQIHDDMEARIQRDPRLNENTEQFQIHPTQLPPETTAYAEFHRQLRVEAAQQNRQLNPEWVDAMVNTPMGMQPAPEIRTPNPGEAPF